MHFEDVSKTLYEFVTVIITKLIREFLKYLWVLETGILALIRADFAVIRQFKRTISSL